MPIALHVPTCSTVTNPYITAQSHGHFDAEFGHCNQALHVLLLVSLSSRDAPCTTVYTVLCSQMRHGTHATRQCKYSSYSVVYTLDQHSSTYTLATQHPSTAATE